VAVGATVIGLVATAAGALDGAAAGAALAMVLTAGAVGGAALAAGAALPEAEGLADAAGDGLAAGVPTAAGALAEASGVRAAGSAASAVVLASGVEEVWGATICTGGGGGWPRLGTVMGKVDAVLRPNRLSTNGRIWRQLGTTTLCPSPEVPSAE
jgi:hypothetical protein